MLKNYLANKLTGSGAMLAIGGVLLLSTLVLVGGKSKEPEKTNSLNGVKKKSTQQRKTKSATVTI